MVQSDTWYNRQKVQCFVKPDKRSKRQKVLSDKMFKIYSVFFFGAVAFWGGGLLGWWPFGAFYYVGGLLGWWPFRVVAFWGDGLLGQWPFRVVAFWGGGLLGHFTMLVAFWGGGLLRWWPFWVVAFWAVAFWGGGLLSCGLLG